MTDNFTEGIDSDEMVLDNDTAQAEEDDVDLNYLVSNLDHFFLLLMGAVVLFMQVGFALIEVGTVRSKNATSILIKNIADFCFGMMNQTFGHSELNSTAGFIAFWLCGYAFAFGEGSPVIGFEKFFAADVPMSELPFFFFQVSSISNDLLLMLTLLRALSRPLRPPSSPEPLLRGPTSTATSSFPPSSPASSIPFKRTGVGVPTDGWETKTSTISPDLASSI